MEGEIFVVFLFVFIYEEFIMNEECGIVNQLLVDMTGLD